MCSPFDAGATEVSAALGEYLANEFREMGHYVVETPYFLDQKLFMDQLLQFAPEERMLVYSGHGFEEKLCGGTQFHCKKTSGGMIDKKNISSLKGINYWCACWAGRNLGIFAEDYAKAILGFDRPVYVFRNRKEHKYMNDWIKIFSEFPLQIAKGKKVSDAYEDFRKACKKYIALYDSHKNDWDNAEWYFSRLIHNLDGGLLFGNRDAKLE